MLEKHFGDIYAAARELGVPGPDLRRLTWAQPSLLENALEEHESVVQRAVGELIRALYSDEPRRRMGRRADHGVVLARNHPFLQRAAAGACGLCRSVVRWAGADAVTPPAAESAVPPISPPPELPRWAGPGPPPPLVAHLYQAWVPPQPAFQLRREPPPQPGPRGRMSRGGYR